MTRWAIRKLRKSDASSRSCRKRRRNKCRGSISHAMLSVIAVKIQLSSPSGDLRSDSVPGSVSIAAPGTYNRALRHAKRSAMRNGVVRQQVKMSAGSSGFVGSCAALSQAPRIITSSPNTAPPVGGLL